MGIDGLRRVETSIQSMIVLFLLICAVGVQAQVLIPPLPRGENQDSVIVAQAPSQWQVIRWLQKPDNFSECILKNISPQLPEDKVEGLIYLCYKNFPQATNVMFKPKNVDACYKKHLEKVGGKEAAKAVYIACEAYFKNVSSSVRP